MAAPTKVYAQKVWANVTQEQLDVLNRRISLTGESVSDIVREALARYLASPPKKRRRAS
jgi:hypothetical protein